MDILMCLNIFCGGLLILILLILWLMFRRMVRPVLSFIFHPVKGNETYVVPRTGFMGVVVLLASIVGFTFLWFSVSTILGVGAELFNPIYFFLLVLAIVVAAGAILGLEYSYRSMYDVLRLERHGVAENPVLGELFHVMGIDDDGTVVSSPFVQYSYAKDFKGNLRLYPEFGEEEAYKKGRLQITNARSSPRLEEENRASNWIGNIPSLRTVAPGPIRNRPGRGSHPPRADKIYARRIRNIHHFLAQRNKNLCPIP